MEWRRLARGRKRDAEGRKHEKKRESPREREGKRKSGASPFLIESKLGAYILSFIGRRRDICIYIDGYRETVGDQERGKARAKRAWRSANGELLSVIYARSMHHQCSKWENEKERWIEARAVRRARAVCQRKFKNHEFLKTPTTRALSRSLSLSSQYAHIRWSNSPSICSIYIYVDRIFNVETNAASIPTKIIRSFSSKCLEIILRVSKLGIKTIVSKYYEAAGCMVAMHDIFVCPRSPAWSLRQGDKLPPQFNEHLPLGNWRSSKSTCQENNNLLFGIFLLFPLLSLVPFL